MLEKEIEGLKVFLLKTPHEQISLQAWFKVGSSSDSPPGIAHFLEHLFFKGSKKYPGITLTETVENLGGEFNAFTSFDYTCYYIQGPSEYQKEFLDLLMDMICSPLFKEEDLVMERQVVYEEYLRYLDQPASYHFERVQDLFFEPPYKDSILGVKDSILNFTHEQAVKFREKFYVKENFFLLVGGNYNLDKIEEALKNKELPSSEKVSSYDLKMKPGFDLHEKDRAQASLLFIMRGESFTHPETPFRDLYLNYLTAPHTSILYKQLVETHLASSVEGSSYYLKNGSMYFLSINFDLKNLKEILKVFKESLKEEPSLEEIQRIIRQLKATKIYDKETLESYTFREGLTYALTNNFKAEEDYFFALEQVLDFDPKKFFQDFSLSLQVPKGSSLEGIKETCEQFQRNLFQENKKEKQKMSSDQEMLIPLNDQSLLYYKFYEDIPTFSFHAYLQGGQGREDKEGLSLMTSELLTYESSTSVYPYENFWQEIQNRAASFYSFNGKMSYGLKTHGFVEDFPFLVRELLARLYTPSFKKESVLKQKKILSSIREERLKDPVKLLFKNVQEKLYFKDHPFGKFPFGTKSSEKFFTSKNLKDFHEKHLQKVVFGFCGYLKIEQVLSALEGKIKVLLGKKIDYEMIEAPKKLINFHLPLEREQTHVFISYGAAKYQEQDSLFFTIIENYFQGQSSELFVKVRDEMGLCYSVGPVYMTSLLGAYFGIYIGTTPEKKEEAIEAIKEILKKLRKGLSLEVFDQVKKKLHYQYLMKKQSPDDFLDEKLPFLVQGLDLNFEQKRQEQLKKLSHSSFQQWAENFFQQKPSVFSVGRK